MDYLSIYNTLIARGQNRMPFQGMHKHRIEPGYKGGKYVQENITYLTRQEHRIVHWIRYRLFGYYGDAIAIQQLGGKNPGGYKGPPTNHSPETLKKIVESRAWYKHPEHIKLRIGKANKGKIRTDQQNENNRQAQLVRWKKQHIKKKRYVRHYNFGTEYRWFVPGTQPKKWIKLAEMF